MKKSYENHLPEGYIQIKHINANDKKTGIVFNLAAIVIMAIIVAAAVLIAVFSTESLEITFNPIVSIVFIASLLAYIVLHELVHGAVYKALTHRKLTFGVTLSCAFCGVPDIYTYRKTALLSLLAPFTVFTVLLIPLCAIMFFANTYAYIATALLLGIHIGGCSGDLYMTLLLLFKYRSKSILIKDTGPEQFIYSNQTEGETLHGAS